MSEQVPLFLTWYDMERDCAFIERWIKQLDVTPSRIYGIPRGGLTLAVMLSHRLGIPMLHNQQLIDDRTVIVDDVIESGNTIRDLIDKIAPYKPLAIYAWCDKSGASHTMNTVLRVEPERWIVFPWETPTNASKEAIEYAKRSTD